MNDKNIEEKSKLIAERNKRLEIIKNIPVNRSNFEYIAESGSINGSLMLDIEKAMDKYQSDTITQYKEALRDIIPLAERAMDNWRGTKGTWVARHNGYYMEVNREEDFEDGQRLAISVFVLNIIGNRCEIDQSGEAEANAQLIAAAPDMLEALLYFRGDMESWSDAHQDVKDKVESAINKALGKEADNE